MIRNLFIEITNNCNFNCTFCPNSIMKRDRGLMESELFFKIIDEIYEKKMSANVHFHLMGEPFLHPKVGEFIKYCGEKEVNIGLISNISLLEKVNIKEILKFVGHLEISLQSFDDESFASRKATRLTFEEYITSIKNLIEMKLSAKSKTVLNITMIENSKNSVKNFKDDSKFIDSNKRLQYFFDTHWHEFFVHMEQKYGTPYTKIDNLNFKNFNHEFLPGVIFNTRCVITWGNTMCKTNKIIPAIRAKCNALHQQLGILWNGDVVPCCLDYDGNVKLGNVQNQSLEDVINSEYYKSMKASFKTGKLLHTYCKKCKGGPNFLSWFISQAYSFIKYRDI